MKGKNRAKTIAIIALAILSTAMAILSIEEACAQPEVEWEKTFGGSYEDAGFCVQQTEDIGFIIVGETDLYGEGWSGHDLWLIKTDAYGDVMWERTYGGSSWEDGMYVQQTYDGGYIIAGHTQSFGEGWQDIYLIKTDMEGNIQWEKTYGGPGYEGCHVIQCVNGLGYVLVGETTSFGEGGEDFWLVKIDMDGNLEWDVTFGGSDLDRPRSIACTSDGGYVITGFTRSYGAGGRDVWLVKADSEGDMVWSKTFGGSDDDYGYSIRMTSDEGFIITGGTRSFGAGGEDVWLIKTDSAGNLMWDETFGGAEDDFGRTVQQTICEGYVITGETKSFGAGDEDLFVIKTDSNGNMIWGDTFGGENRDIGCSVRQTHDTGYIIAGFTESFDSGNRDCYLIKLESEALWSLRELKDEIDELSDEAFRKPRLADTRAKVLLRKLSKVERRIQRGKYRPALRVLDRSIRRRIRRWIAQPWRSELLDKVDYIVSNIP